MQLLIAKEYTDEVLKKLDKVGCPYIVDDAQGALWDHIKISDDISTTDRLDLYNYFNNKIFSNGDVPENVLHTTIYSTTYYLLNKEIGTAEYCYNAARILLDYKNRSCHHLSEDEYRLACQILRCVNDENLKRVFGNIETISRPVVFGDTLYLYNLHSTEENFIAHYKYVISVPMVTEAGIRKMITNFAHLLKERLVKGNGFPLTKSYSFAKYGIQVSSMRDEYVDSDILNYVGISESDTHTVTIPSLHSAYDDLNVLCLKASKEITVRVPDYLGRVGVFIGKNGDNIKGVNKQYRKRIKLKNFE